MESKDFLMVVDASSMLTRGNPTHEDIMNCPWQWRRPFLDDKRRFRKRRVADGCFYDPVDPAFVDHLMPGPGFRSKSSGGVLNVEEQSKVAQEIERLMAQQQKEKGGSHKEDADGVGEEQGEFGAPKCARCCSWGRSGSVGKRASASASSLASSTTLCSCFASSCWDGEERKRKRVCRRSQSWSAQTHTTSTSIGSSQSETALMDSILVFSQAQHQPDDACSSPSASISCSSPSSSSPSCNDSSSTPAAAASTPPASAAPTATANSPTSTATSHPFMDCLRLNDDENDAEEQDGHESSMLALVSDDYGCEQTYDYFAFADDDDLFGA